MTATLIVGSGLVGTQVAALEQSAGREPIVYDLFPRTDAISDFVDLGRATVVRGNVLDPLHLADVIHRHGITTIVHTAANPGLTAANPGLTAGAADDPMAAVNINVVGTANVLEAASRFGVERVVVCSSSALYASVAGGEDQGQPGREEIYPRPSTVYATTKQAAENLALNYAATRGLDTRVVRFASVFGPWKPGGGGLATEAIESYVRGCLRDKQATVGPLSLEWVYSRDAARGLWLAAHVESTATRVFNIGSGVVVAADELADAIRAVFPEADVSLADADAMSVQAMDPARAAQQLGYAPEFHPIERALDDYRTWMERSSADPR